MRCYRLTEDSGEMLGPMAMGIAWPPTVSYMFFYLAYWSSRGEWAKLVEYVEGLLMDINTKRSLVRNNFKSFY